jgi:bifunctional UDP-N-acetylglucosamine pyrophosphorylase/glucosamine-1-phosphate N-acetyltransferase
VEKPILVVGYQSDQVRAAVGERANFVEQSHQRGTGHAVMQTRAMLEKHADAVIVTYADMPLVTGETMRALYEKHNATRACITILTVISEDSMGFGRVIREDDGKPIRVVEEVEATTEEFALKELNCGVYCFDARWLWENLEKLKPSPKKGEYYLTDLIGIAIAQSAPVETETLRDVNEVIGINTRVHLARAEKIVRDRIRERVMLDGTTLIDPQSTFIDWDVEIGEDSIILPGTHLQGTTKIGAECRIGPNALIRDSVIGDACTIGASVIEASTLEDHVEMGPFCHLRPKAYLSRGVHLGNYAEVKNSRLGEGVHMGHFSYMGDADVGARVNIGAGTITCNYDGKKKSPTVIGDDAFIGSDTMLVAPVVVGARARTGAGAVVIQDIPPDTLAVGVPARVVRTLA